MAGMKAFPILFFACCAVALGQIRYPAGEDYVNAMAGADGKIFAATNAGLFASGDEGRTWSSVPGLDMQVAGLIVFGGKLLAATDNGLYRKNGDGSWERIASGGDGLGFGSLKAVGNTLEVASWDTRYISQDGSHWSRAPISLALHRTLALAASPQGFLYAFAQQGPHFISMDGGTSWQPQPLFSGGDGVWGVQAVFASDGAAVYYSVIGGTIYRAPGNVPLFSSTEAQGIPGFGVIGKYLLVGYRGGMVRSSDQGASFQPAGQGLGSGQTLRLAAGSVSVFAQQTNGIYRSQDSGKTWSKILSGTWNDGCFAAAGKEIYVSEGTRLYHSLDNGDSWTSVDNPTHYISGEYNTMAITTRGLLHKAGGGGLWSTVNQGKDWDFWPGPPGPNGIQAMTTIGDRFVVAPDTGILVSDDFGKSWKQPDSAPVPRAIGGLVSRGEDIYTSRSSAIYHSVNGGKTWVALNHSGLPDADITSLAWVGDTLYAGLGTADGTGLYFSKGPGAAWQAAPVASPRSVQAIHGLPGGLLIGSSSDPMAVYSPSAGSWSGVVAPDNARKISGFFQDSSRLFAFSSGNGIFASADGGKSWEAIPIGSTAIGIGKGPADGKPAEGIRMSGFRSADGYFIQYTLPRPCRISLTLVSIDGGSIRLFSGVPRQAGRYLAKLPSGSGLRGPFRYRVEVEENGGSAAP